MNFSPLKRHGAAEQVASTIRDAILGGEYVPGDPLPSERILADQFEVNRGTVREALKRLDAWGLVETRHGGKTRVRDFLVSAGLQLLPQLIAPAGRVDHEFIRDLLQLRVVLLGFTARLAAERCEASGLDELRASLEALEASDTAAELQASDWEFFMAITRMSGNRILAMMAHVIGEVYGENQALFSMLYQPAVFDLNHHREAVAAVEAGDSEAAQKAMTRYGELASRLTAGN
jgi:DNA-binding FadR family transcriptional regulator